MTRSRIAYSLLILLLSSACAGNELHPSSRSNGTQAPSSTIDSEPSTTEAGEPDISDQFLEWESCDAGFDCTTLSVPLDWQKPEGDRIDLAITRKKAEGTRIGALVTNPGGPGGSGIDFIQSGPFGGELAKSFDLVSFDPRGVGASEGLQCDEFVDDHLKNDPDPDTPEEQAALDRDAAKVADQCSTEELLPFMGTDSVARDLDAIRAALGEKKLTYMGFSYGTMIGLRYLELFPRNARAIVLDGVVDPTADLKGLLRQQTIAINDSVNRAFETCTKRAGCTLGDAAAAYDKLAERVEKEPMKGSGDLNLGPSELATGAIYVSYDPSLWGSLLDALTAALEEDDPEPMLDLAAGYYDFGGFASYVAVECIDNPHPNTPAEWALFSDELEQLSPRFGGSIANELLPCATWAAPTQSVVGPVRGELGPEVLVLGNRGDAATPYDNSVSVAEMLAQAQLVSYDGEGHTSYGRTRCVDEVVEAYLIDLDVPERDPDCK